MKRLQYLNPPGAPPAQGLYSHVTRVDSGVLFLVSGQLAVGDDGSIVGKGNFAEQFHRVFANLEYVLAGIGAGFRDVAKFTTYLVDPANIDEFMSLRAALFPTRFGDGLYPPNTLLIVQRLVKAEFLIEVEAIVRAPE